MDSDKISVEVLRHPTKDDWERCKMLALNTIGKRYAGSEVTDEWKYKILRSEHSPIRTLMFTIRITDIPYWVAMHFRTHKYGIEHYISSQRNDRQTEYDRNKAPQDHPVSYIMDVNAAELMQMARMRLCRQASRETREVMRAICDAVVETNPEFEPFFVPKCLARGGCNEFVPCGYYESVKKWMEGVLR